MSQLFTWDGQSTRVSASESVLPMNTQGWSPLEWTGWISLQSKGCSGVFSNTAVQKHQFFGAISMKLGWGRIPVIVAFSLGLCYSCSRSSRGNECQQTQELDLRDQSRPPCPLPRPGNILSAHHSHCGSHFQGYNLERASCGWEHLDCICDWSQLNLCVNF